MNSVLPSAMELQGRVSSSLREMILLRSAAGKGKGQMSSEQRGREEPFTPVIV